MDLGKITIKSVSANDVKHLVSTLEDLPEETIQGDAFFIDAYYSLPQGTELIILCNKEESETIKFNAPKNSEIVRKSDNKLEFDYKDRRYSLIKELEKDCSP